MASIVEICWNKNLVSPPGHLRSNIHYEVIMGSYAYGVSGDTSDVDVYGFSIPYKDMIFPHLKGEIPGFGRQVQRFEQWQQHHVKDDEVGKEYDFAIYNIVKYFNLCMENNPNMIDSLFVPQRCLLHCTRIGNIVRENRRMFLHKGSWFKYKGYAYSQMNKIRTKHNIVKNIHSFEEENDIPHNTTVDEAKSLMHRLIESSTKTVDTSRWNKYITNLNSLYENGFKRALTVREHGFDRKFAYHVVRLLNEGEQILTEGDLDLERSREQLKSIRRGEWSFEEIQNYFDKKERELESLYTNSTLRHSPDEHLIKNLLLNCLEEHFGTLGNVITRTDNYQNVIEDLKALLHKYENRL